MTPQEALAGKKFYKFTNSTCNHNRLQYHNGPNVDFRPWNNNTCAAGGIYVADAAHPFEWMNYRDLEYVWDAEIDFDFPVSIEVNHKVKCHKVWLSNCRPIVEMPELQTEEGKIAAVERDKHNIMHIPTAEEWLKLYAVTSRPAIIEFIPNPSIKLIKAAASEVDEVLKYIMDISIEDEQAVIDINPKTYAFARYEYSRELIEKWINQEPKIIKYIPNADVTLQRLALQSTRYQHTILSMIPNLDETLSIELFVQHGPNILRWMNNVNPTLQIIAIKKNPNNMRNISRPCYEAIEYMLQEDSKNIEWVMEKIIPIEAYKKLKQNFECIQTFKVTTWIKNQYVILRRC